MKPFRILPYFLVGSALGQSLDLLPQRLGELVVTTSALDRTLFELAQPACVLRDEQLSDQLQATLGDTLDGQAGVSATRFGPGASRPIIRGLGEDRVRILQNGTSVLDVSNVSPDHAVATDPLSIKSVELVRGPATLLYGPNTVGGVVNVIDSRIPEERIEGLAGAMDARFGTVDEMKSFSGALDFGRGSWAFHLDGFQRETEDLEIPSYARSERLRRMDPQTEEAYGVLPNSFTQSDGGALGASYLFKSGFLGASFSGMNSLYGTVAEEDVSIDLRQRRWDVRGAVYEPVDWVKEWNFKFSHSDYAHTEFEGAEVGTRFLIDGFNARTELLHKKQGNFEGLVGLELQRNEFSALGSEAFLPAVENMSNSGFVYEEIRLDAVTLQFGARYDYQSNETAEFERSFHALNLSSGVVYVPVEDYALALSFGYSQRPPTYVELFAEGLHVATGTYEIGDPDLGKENSFSVDLSLRKKAGRVTGSVSGFYYRFEDFISMQPTGADFIDDGEAFPEFAYEAGGADFYGAEFETVYHVLSPQLPETDAKSPGDAGSGEQTLDLILRGDWVRAESRETGEPVPRIPPFRVTLAADGQWQDLGARLEGQWVAQQDRIADYELPTDGYFLVNAGMDYRFQLGEAATTLFLKGVNLLDEEARQSTSFLKDVAPLAGRGWIAGLRMEF
jgi:iron complex outermembrane receptor protein